MIKEFKNNPIRKSGIVYGKMLEVAKRQYMRDPVKGGEYAISFLEAILTGDISSDDINIEDALEGYVDRIKKSKNLYDAKVAASEERFSRIVEMKKNGMTQAAIARELGVQPPAVSKMFTRIRTEFPHLLEELETKETLETFPNDSGNIGNFQDTLEILETEEMLTEVSESFQESMEISSEQGNIGNVSEFPKFPHYNYDYNQNYNQNYNFTRNSSSSSPSAPPKTTPKFDF